VSGDLFEPGHPGHTRIFSERAWKQRHKDYEGDSFSPPGGPADIIVLGWEDASETPSEAIARLNNEVIEIAAELRAIKNAHPMKSDAFRMWWQMGQLNKNLDSLALDGIIREWARRLGIKKYVFSEGGDFQVVWEKPE